MSEKAQNDPWSPMAEATNGGFPLPPADPRHQLIDSDRYIDSLEKKLRRVKGKNKPAPSSQDIIDSLSGFRDDQMRRFMDRDPTVAATSAADSDLHVSFLQRRMYPEKQAVNMQELFELLKDDELARNRTEDEEASPDYGPSFNMSDKDARRNEADDQNTTVQDPGEISAAGVSIQKNDISQEKKEVDFSEAER